MSCACLLTALLVAGPVVSVDGGVRATNQCASGVFHYEGTQLVMMFGMPTQTTTIRVELASVLPLSMSTVVSYCLVEDFAMVGAMRVPVTVHSDEALVRRGCVGSPRGERESGT
jgi:riboflavin synthase